MEQLFFHCVELCTLNLFFIIDTYIFGHKFEKTCKFVSRMVVLAYLLRILGIKMSKE